jgi:hypothetical protein
MATHSRLHPSWFQAGIPPYAYACACIPEARYKFFLLSRKRPLPCRIWKHQSTWLCSIPAWKLVPAWQAPAGLCALVVGAACTCVFALSMDQGHDSIAAAALSTYPTPYSANSCTWRAVSPLCVSTYSCDTFCCSYWPPPVGKESHN